MAVITNIDADHMESYGHDFERLKRAFVDFAQRLPFYGVAVCASTIRTCARSCRAITKPRVTYGVSEDASIRGIDIANEGGRMRFVARAANAADLPVVLNLAGVHNVLNALARDRDRPRSRCSRRSHRESTGRVSRRGPPLPALWRDRARTAARTR
jgi:UDP-N-acetylmuramate--alanine ligase